MAAIFYTLATLKSRINDEFADKERGATAVEYGIMVAAIAVVIIAVVFTLGDDIKGMFEGVSDEITKDRSGE